MIYCVPEILRFELICDWNGTLGQGNNRPDLPVPITLQNSYFGGGSIFVPFRRLCQYDVSVSCRYITASFSPQLGSD